MGKRQGERDVTEIEPQKIPGLKPWLCEYMKDGKPYGITLYAASPEQILEDHCDVLQGLKVVGELVLTVVGFDGLTGHEVQK